MKALVAFLTVLVIISETSSAQPQVSVPFIRCPDDRCSTDLEEVFSSCARYISAGCTILSCETNGFRCTYPLRPDDTDSGDDDTLTIGTQTAPDISQLSIFDEASFSVILSVPRIKSDLYVLADGTGGVVTAGSSLRAEYHRILEEFNPGADNAFGVGFFRDELSPETDNGFVNLQSITKSVPHISQAFDSLTFQGGFDLPEANLVALHRLATDDSIGWRDGARRTIVYFGDAPGHEPTCDDGVVLDRHRVIDELNEKNISVAAASLHRNGLNGATTRFGECSSAPAGPRGQAYEIVSRTGGGEVVESSGQREVVSAILNAVRDKGTVFELDTSDCDDFLTARSTQALPVTLSPSDALEIGLKVRVNSGCRFPSSADEFECALRFTGQMDGHAKRVLRTIKITGCQF